MFEHLKKWLEVMNNRNITCACCGKCCELYGGHLHAYDSDIKRWKSEGREDLLQMVNYLGWIWVDPVTKEPLGRCPFIQSSETSDLVLCSINDTKPLICRDYPPMEHGRRCIRGNRS